MVKIIVKQDGVIKHKHTYPESYFYYLINRIHTDNPNNDLSIHFNKDTPNDSEIIIDLK